ncbi:MAG: hypothetical protein HYR79_07370 [Nitrospirae bacterium]|nr:hypothetical protein [Nitrospirota bacterium]
MGSNSILFLCSLWSLISLSPVYSQSLQENQIDVITYDGIINPVASEFIAQSIDEADRKHAEVLILQLDTPGGLDSSMRLIAKKILSSEVPVVVYVFPSGARAASAGLFILEAAHFAVMAPGTNIGAAHPVSMGGGEMTKEMSQKVENDAAAYIQSITEKRGRNSIWVQRAVRESVSISETEALSLKVIDWVSPGLNDLVSSLDGKTVLLEKGKKTLHTRNGKVNIKKMGQRLRILNAIIDPNITYIVTTQECQGGKSISGKYG